MLQNMTTFDYIVAQRQMQTTGAAEPRTHDGGARAALCGRSNRVADVSTAALAPVHRPAKVSLNPCAACNTTKLEGSPAAWGHLGQAGKDRKGAPADNQAAPQAETLIAAHKEHFSSSKIGESELAKGEAAAKATPVVPGESGPAGEAEAAVGAPAPAPAEVLGGAEGDEGTQAAAASVQATGAQDGQDAGAGFSQQQGTGSPAEARRQDGFMAAASAAHGQQQSSQPEAAERDAGAGPVAEGLASPSCGVAAIRDAAARLTAQLHMVGALEPDDEQAGKALQELTSPPSQLTMMGTSVSKQKGMKQGSTLGGKTRA